MTDLLSIVEEKITDQRTRIMPLSPSRSPPPTTAPETGSA